MDPLVVNKDASFQQSQVFAVVFISACFMVLFIHFHAFSLLVWLKKLVSVGCLLHEFPSLTNPDHR